MDESKSASSNSKPLLCLVAAVLFGLGICGTYIYFANNHCVVGNPQQSQDAHNRKDETATRRKNNRSGDEISPLEFMPLDVLQPDKKTEETSQQGKQKNHEPESWAGKFFCEAKAADIALVFFTWCLVVVTGYLAWATLKLWQSGDEMGGIAQKSADIAEKQMLIAGQQTDIISKQHALDRLQFLARNRPIIRIRHITVGTGHHIGYPTFFFSHGNEIHGSLVVVNVGGTKAKIVESRYKVYFSAQGLPPTAPYDTDFQELILADTILGAGESCTVTISEKIFMDPKDADRTNQFDTGGWSLYVMGQIRFQDVDGAERFMGFCREWHRAGRFQTVDDPDYEYQD